MAWRMMSVLVAVLGLAGLARGAEERPAIKVLWCTGGGFHDYKGLTPYLQGEIAKYAKVKFEVSDDYKAWDKKGFADGYDVLVIFTSAHDKEAAAVTANIAETIKAGKPAIFIHGSLHAFRELAKDRESFCEAMGLTSSAHDKAGPMATKKVAEHATTKFWPADWKTPSDELYQNIKLWPSATALMTAYSETSKKDHVVTWVNEYGKAKVFGTSLGHDKKTAGMETYHQLLANGILWVCDKLDENGKPKAGYEGTGEKK